jgi:precorrin-6Y C5,15-methyltransferase (decarboxylating)
MTHRIDIIGIGADGADGLQPAQVERVLAADFLAGGERHLGYFPAAPGERFTVRDNLAELMDELGRRYPQQRCVVLASGDPLFYGIGTYLSEIYGPTQVRVEPAVSSMQLTFARVGLSWQRAALASIHGRDLRRTLLPLLGQPLLGLFTQDGNSPAAVAHFFLHHGLNEYEAFVGENLGAADERLSHWGDLRALSSVRFSPLNYLILRRTSFHIPGANVEQYRSLVPGIPDNVFARPENGHEVMTRQEVRSVLVGKLLGAAVAGDTVWDIGAGLGTVAVEVAVLRPQVEVVAVDRDPVRAGYLRQNRERFGAYNIRVVEGTAPEALTAEVERPNRVFIGGSGDRLGAILDLATERLQPGGRLLASFVTLEHLALMLQQVQAWHWRYAVTEIHVSRSDALAGLTGMKPQRGVFLVEADKPGMEEATHE